MNKKLKYLLDLLMFVCPPCVMELAATIKIQPSYYILDKYFDCFLFPRHVYTNHLISFLSFRSMRLAVHVRLFSNAMCIDLYRQNATTRDNRACDRRWSFIFSPDNNQPSILDSEKKKDKRRESVHFIIIFRLTLLLHFSRFFRVLGTGVYDRAPSMDGARKPVIPAVVAVTHL